MMCKLILFGTFLNEPELIFLQLINWLIAILQSDTNNSIDYLSFISTKLNVFKYCYITVTI